MKHLIYYALIISTIGLLTIRCEKENDKPLKITGQLISNTDCKDQLKSTLDRDETPDNQSCVEYSFDTGNNKLTLKHINAGFNCCPESLYCKVELKNDTILIREFEKSALCKCNCLYDLVIEINGVDTRKYTIKFIEPYISGQDELIFDIDLKKDTNGSFCVARKLYPWGMVSLNK